MNNEQRTCVAKLLTRDGEASEDAVALLAIGSFFLLHCTGSLQSNLLAPSQPSTTRINFFLISYF